MIDLATVAKEAVTWRTEDYADWGEHRFAEEIRKEAPEEVWKNVANAVIEALAKEADENKTHWAVGANEYRWDDIANWLLSHVNE